MSHIFEFHVTLRRQNISIVKKIRKKKKKKKIRKQRKEKHLNFSDFPLETYKEQNLKHYSFIEVSI